MFCLKASTDADSETTPVTSDSADSLWSGTDSDADNEEEEDAGRVREGEAYVVGNGASIPEM